MRIPIPRWIANVIVRASQGNPYFNLKHRDGSPYMDRWWLLPRFLLREVTDNEGTYLKPVAWLPFAPRVHWIRSSDLDRHLHDHPFGYCTWLLAGGYWEVLPVSIDPKLTTNGAGEDREPINWVWRPPGTIMRKCATDRHRIVLDGVQGAWTLFVAFRKVQTWGFYTERGKVYWWNYGKGEPPRRFFGRDRVSVVAGEEVRRV